MTTHPPPPPPMPIAPPVPPQSMTKSTVTATARTSTALQQLLARNAAETSTSVKQEPVFVSEPIFHNERCQQLYQEEQEQQEKQQEQTTTEPKLRKLRFVIVSDSHNSHNHLCMPDGDVLIHCGDMTDWGSESEVQRFNDEFLGRVKHKYSRGVFVICGNHEEGLAQFRSRPTEIQSRLSHGTYLQDSSVVIDGRIVLYGAPWVPNMGSLPNEKHMKAFDDKMFYMGEQALAGKWQQIPTNTNILITHTPPKYVLDGALHYGCDQLAQRLEQLDHVRVHCFGHVHMGYGYTVDRVKCRLSVNAAVDTDEQPIVFDYYYD